MTLEIFDRHATPPEIAELLAEWPEMDPGTARLVRAAIMSRSPQRLRVVWHMLAARARLAQSLRPG